MKSIFTIHQKTIEFEKYNEPYYLLPVGDIHRYAPLCDEPRYLEFLDWAKNKPRKLILGMGDYDDMLSTSERFVLNTNHLHESTRESLNDIYKLRVRNFAKEWDVFKEDEILGLMEGNHYTNLIGDFTSTQYLAHSLNTKYLGVSSFIRLHFNHKTRNCRSKVDIWAHHGLGAAKKIGGSLNRVEDMATMSDADILLMGHDHKKSAGFLTTMTLNTGRGALKLEQRKRLIARTGSFLKSYVNGKDSYVAGRCLSPADLGAIKIELTPRLKDKTQYIDIHVSL